MEPAVEHRKHQRYPVRFKSIFSTDGAHLEDGLVLDLSLGVCRLTSAIHVSRSFRYPDRNSYSARSTLPHFISPGPLYVGEGIPSSGSSSKSYLNSNRQR